MKNLIAEILPTNDRQRKWTVVVVISLISGLLTLWGIYGLGEYGIALFIFIPLFIGAGSTILYGLKKEVAYKESWELGLLTLSIFALGLLLFAIEGLICIIMAAPLGTLLSLLGSSLGYVIIRKTPNNAQTMLLIIIGIIPLMAFM